MWIQRLSAILLVTLCSTLLRFLLIPALNRLVEFPRCGPATLPARRPAPCQVSQVTDTLGELPFASGNDRLNAWLINPRLDLSIPSWFLTPMDYSDLVGVEERHPDWPRSP